MAQLRAFLWNFLAHFGTLCYFLWFLCTIRVFLTFNAVLSRIRFVVIYALFRVIYFWPKPCWCKKKIFLHVCTSLGFFFFKVHAVFWKPFNGNKSQKQYCTSWLIIQLQEIWEIYDSFCDKVIPWIVTPKFGIRSQRWDTLFSGTPCSTFFFSHTRGQSGKVLGRRKGRS